ncbi:hypothetical protein BS50DRAFT_590424 [Corynespora cassiicola Philippines]|uniref:Uncharacterized protein n=1 Tax=Corynespora cassiicola Philippines TaxID=1448308 RepID=A0A2T2NGS6_CORCC|nr:hypothetical protein BS50DRAFT_590424 [Corynespora cassiicola Philippines]
MENSDHSISLLDPEGQTKILRVIEENPGAFPQYDFKSIYSKPRVLEMAEVLMFTILAGGNSCPDDTMEFLTSPLKDDNMKISFVENIIRHLFWRVENFDLCNPNSTSSDQSDNPFLTKWDKPVTYRVTDFENWWKDGEDVPSVSREELAEWLIKNMEMEENRDKPEMLQWKGMAMAKTYAGLPKIHKTE